MTKPKRARRITDTGRINFLQSKLKGKVLIASSDAEGVISFKAFGRGLRQSIDIAIRAERKESK